MHIKNAGEKTLSLKILDSFHCGGTASTSAFFPWGFPLLCGEEVTFMVLHV